MSNEMTLQFSALSQNESFARVTISAFLTQLDPTLEQLTEMKTVVSEAVTNAIIHGYNEDPSGLVTIYVSIDVEDKITIRVSDEGVGINNIEEAMQPLYTTKPELERSGMGFTIMENFMDSCVVQSNALQGTTVTLTKYLSKDPSFC